MPDTSEQWVCLHGMMVSSFGRVRYPGGNLIEPYLRRGHPCVTLPPWPGPRFERRVARLVAEAFIRPLRKSDVVRHRNGDRLDCRVSNLLIVKLRGPSKIDLFRARELRADGLSRSAVCKLTGVGHWSLRASERTETSDP